MNIVTSDVSIVCQRPVQHLRRKIDFLQKNEFCKIIKIMSNLGVSKIRFTGGEPLAHKDLLDLVELLV